MLPYFLLGSFLFLARDSFSYFLILRQFCTKFVTYLSYNHANLLHNIGLKNVTGLFSFLNNNVTLLTSIDVVYMGRLICLNLKIWFIPSVLMKFL